MKVCGIICEYNPFHNGHILHIQKAKEITGCDVLVCIMSGQFVQRGEAAITNKWERAKTAIEHGCDVVFELPFLYCVQSANHFAKGGMDCLKLADADYLVFGSESNNLEILKQFAGMDTGNLSLFTKEGLSPAKAYERIYGTWNANDILGINYLKEMDDTMTAFTIQRTNNYHEEDLQHNISSATSIRKAVKEKRIYQSQTPMTLDNTFSMEKYYPLIQTLLLTLDKTYLQQLFLMDEGIENLFVKTARQASTYEKFVDACISKRYTRARIQRTLIHLLNQTTKEKADNMPEMKHLRLLAYNDKGKAYLKKLKEKEEVTVASKITQVPEAYRDMEIKATSVYAFPLSENEKKEYQQKELQPPIYVSETKEAK